MRWLLIALVCGLVGGQAWGVVDPTPDLLGLYFDETADTYCREWLSPFTPFDMYVVYSNASVPEIVGFEFGMETPSQLTRLQVSIACNPFWDPIEGFPYVVGCPEPLPVGEATVLAHFSFMTNSMDMEPIHFFMHAAEVPSIPGEFPLVLLPDGELLPLQVRGAPDEPTAILYGECIVGTEPVSWSSIKAIYR